MDELDYIVKLAGINEFKGFQPVELTHEDAAENRKIEREKNIQPGTDEWFKLWFSRPYMTKGFRGRVKK